MKRLSAASSISWVILIATAGITTVSWAYGIFETKDHAQDSHRQTDRRIDDMNAAHRREMTQIHEAIKGVNGKLDSLILLQRRR